MNIIVFSDSHGDADTMEAVVRGEAPDMVLHLGDHFDDALRLQSLFPGIPMAFVRGNTDLGAVCETEKRIDVGGVTIFMAHGDTYDVQDGIEGITAADAAEGANIVLFGHTHQALLTREGGVWVINPGRIGRLSSKHIDATYGHIQISGGIVRCGIVPYI